MQNVKSLVQAFVIATSLYNGFVSHALSQPEPSPAEASSSQVLDKIAFQDRLRQELYKEPRIYESLSSIISSATDRDISREEEKFVEIDNKKKTVEYFTPDTILSIQTPLSGTLPITLSSSFTIYNAERAMKSLNADLSAEDDKIRQEMLQNPYVVDEVLQRMTENLFSDRSNDVLSPSDKRIVDFYDSFLKQRTPTLPEPVTFQTQLKFHPNAADMLARIGLDNKTVNLLLSGRIKPEQALEAVGKTEADVISFFENEVNINQTNINIDTHLTNEQREQLGLNAIDSRIKLLKAEKEKPGLSDQQQKTVDEQIKTFQNRREFIQLQAHKNDVRKIREEASNLTSIVSFLLPDKAKEVQSTHASFEAGLSIYDNIGSMLISGLSTGGIASLATGISSLVSIFGNSGPSADEIIIGKLNEILENQRKILLHLNRIEEKVDIIDSNIRHLITLTRELSEASSFERMAIKRQLDDIAKHLTRDTRIAFILAQEGTLGGLAREVEARKRSLGGSAFEHYNDCIENYDVCPHDYIRKIFTEIEGTQAKILSMLSISEGEDNLLITDNIIDSNTFTERQRLQFLVMEYDKFEDNFELDDEQNYAILPDIINWLNGHTNGGISGHNAIPTHTLTGLPHPTHFASLLKEYVYLGAKLPPNSNSPDHDLRKIVRLATKLESASALLRDDKTIQLAEAVFHYYLDSTELLIQSHFSLHKNDTLPQSAYIGSTIIRGAYGLPFAGQDVGLTLSGLSNLEVAKYGEKLELLELSEEEFSQYLVKKTHNQKPLVRREGKLEKLVILSQIDESLPFVLSELEVSDITHNLHNVTDHKYARPTKSAVDKGFASQNARDNISLSYTTKTFLRFNQPEASWESKYPYAGAPMKGKIPAVSWLNPDSKAEWRYVDHRPNNDWNEFISIFESYIESQHDKVLEAWKKRDDVKALANELARAMYALDVIVRSGYGQAFETHSDLEEARKRHKQTIERYHTIVKGLLKPNNLNDVVVAGSLAKNVKKRYRRNPEAMLAKGGVGEKYESVSLGMGYPLVVRKTFQEASLYDPTLIDPTSRHMIPLAVSPSVEMIEVMKQAQEIYDRLSIE